MEKARAHQRSSRKNERARGERNTIDEVDLSACAMGLNVPFSAPLLGFRRGASARVEGRAVR
jgi:hypothetical protein